MPGSPSICWQYLPVRQGPRVVGHPCAIVIVEIQCIIVWDFENP